MGAEHAGAVNHAMSDPDDLSPLTSVKGPIFAPSTPLDPGSTVGHLLRRAQQRHTRLFTDEFDSELTGPQYAMLSVLARRPGTDQTSAALLASLDTSTAADIVARMVRNGWFLRRRSEGDARRNELTLTPAARAGLWDITPRVASVQDRLLAAVPAARRAAVVNLLVTVAFPESGTTRDLPPDDRAPSITLTSAPGHLIRRAEQLHRQHWTRRVGNVLTPTQYALLSSLFWNPGVDQSTMGELASLDKASTVSIVARLNQGGLLSTDRDGANPRRRRLMLTAAAVATLEEVTPAVEQVQHDLLSPLDPLQADELVDGLRAIAYVEF